MTHSSLQECLRFLGCSATQSLSSLHRYFFYRVEVWGLASCSFVVLYCLYFWGVIGHCLKTHLWSTFSLLVAGKEILMILGYMVPSIGLSVLWSRLARLAEKQPPSMFPFPCLSVGKVFSGSYSAFFLLQTRQIELVPEGWIFGYTWQPHSFSKAFSESFRCSLENFS